jgi:hypothetical protein
MLASRNTTLNAARAAGQHAVPAVRAPIRPFALNSVQQKAQTLLVPRLSKAEVIAQRVRAAAVAGMRAMQPAGVSTCLAA